MSSQGSVMGWGVLSKKKQYSDYVQDNIMLMYPDAYGSWMGMIVNVGGAVPSSPVLTILPDGDTFVLAGVGTVI